MIRLRWVWRVSGPVRWTCRRGRATLIGAWGAWVGGGGADSKCVERVGEEGNQKVMAELQVEQRGWNELSQDASGR